jgi:hypothetical protein
MIITILRKPLEGSVADNTLKHGCGAINIDDTRIGNIVQDTSKNGRSPDKHKSTVFQSGLKEDFEGKITTGRWPANFILTHKEGCELKGTKKVKSGTAHQDNKTKSNYVYGGFSPVNMKGKAGYADEDGKETVADWICIEGCPVAELDRQSGVSKSTGGRVGNAQGVYSNQGRTGWGTGHEKGEPGFGDTGGASRFFKQFKTGNDQ